MQCRYRHIYYDVTDFIYCIVCYEVHLDGVDYLPFYCAIINPLFDVIYPFVFCASHLTAVKISTLYL